MLRHPMSVTTFGSTPPTSTTHSEAPQLWMGAISPPHVSAVQSCSKQGRSSGCSSCSNSTTRMNDARRNRDVASKPVNASWSGSVGSVLSQPVARWPTTRQPCEGSCTSSVVSKVTGAIRSTRCPSIHLQYGRTHAHCMKAVFGRRREHQSFTKLSPSDDPSTILFLQCNKAATISELQPTQTPSSYTTTSSTTRTTKNTPTPPAPPTSVTTKSSQSHTLARRACRTRWCVLDASSHLGGWGMRCWSTTCRPAQSRTRRRWLQTPCHSRVFWDSHCLRKTHIRE